MLSPMRISLQKGKTMGRSKIIYKLLNVRALKISTLYKKSYLLKYGYDILCGIANGTFDITHKISHPYIERYGFYSNLRALRLNNS